MTEEILKISSKQMNKFEEKTDMGTKLIEKS